MGAALLDDGQGRSLPHFAPKSEFEELNLMRIAIASDHAAVELKAELAAWMTSEGHEVADIGLGDGRSKRSLSASCVQDAGRTTPSPLPF